MATDYHWACSLGHRKTPSSLSFFCINSPGFFDVFHCLENRCREVSLNADFLILFPFCKDTYGLFPSVSLLIYNNVKMYYDIVYAIKRSCYCHVSSVWDHKYTLIYSSVICLEWMQFLDLSNLGESIGSSKHAVIVTTSTSSSSGPFFNWRCEYLTKSPSAWRYLHPQNPYL